MVASNRDFREEPDYVGRNQTLAINHQREAIETYADQMRTAYAEYFLDMYEHDNPFNASLSVFGEQLSEEDL